AFARGGFSTMGEATSLQWYYLTGGVLGAAYVTTVLVTVRELGAGPVVAATIAGQLSASVVLDQFGLLGLPKDPITLGKVIGVLLLAAGVYLVVRE
ncbi:MAG TPA: DMT family transporter, partial [Solirubrobacteraceae bacterium]